MRMRRGVAYYPTFEVARDVGARDIRGFPAWRVVPYGLGWAIQYRPGGPYFPELEPEDNQEDPAQAQNCEELSTGAEHFDHHNDR